VEPDATVDAEVYASHHQFYVVDPEANRLDFDWGGADLERHLAVGPSVVAVGTIAYEIVSVRLETWAGEPPLDESCDHVVEASIDLPSGRLAIENVDGPVGAELELEPGMYRLRASAGGLDGATEMAGGDAYVIQLWLAPSAEPCVIRWWPPWDPAAARAAPTTAAGRVLLGAEAHDARVEMTWLASRGSAQLFRGVDGALWEHSTLRDAAGTAQLEELDGAEAKRRYGPADRWQGVSAFAPGLGTLAKSLWQTFRYRRGWRPDPDPVEAVVEDGRRTYVGTTAIDRLAELEWLVSEGGRGLYRDDVGALWEYRNEDAAGGRPRLRELARDEAAAKYGDALGREN